MTPDLSKMFDVFSQSVDKVSTLNDYLDKNINIKTAEFQKHKNKSVLYQQCSEVIKSWLEEMLDKNVNSIADLVTNGLSNIIDDQDIKFSIKQEPKYNKISMRFVMSMDGCEGDPMMSYGGGAVLISSLILRLAIMSRLKMANLLILDESLHALALKYVPQCGEFMRQLSERTGINILMVTHCDEFLNHAHTSYEGSSVYVGEVDGHSVHKLRLTPHGLNNSL